MNYILEKLAIKDGHYSSVRVGYKVEGSILATRKLMTDAEVARSPDIGDIEVGDMILVTGGISYGKTSPISNIVERDTNSLTFETGTSIYKLEVEDE
jgi:hypothetical protein